MNRSGSSSVFVLSALLVFVVVAAVGLYWALPPSGATVAKSAVTLATRNWDGKTVPEVGLDPWGRPYRVTVTEGSVYRVLEVRSDGRDGLPFTADDVFASSTFKHGSISKEVGNSLRVIGRNAAQGVTEGIKGGITKDPPPEEP